jgi:hypothetical protein
MAIQNGKLPTVASQMAKTASKLVGCQAVRSGDVFMN